MALAVTASQYQQKSREEVKDIGIELSESVSRSAVAKSLQPHGL